MLNPMRDKNEGEGKKPLTTAFPRLFQKVAEGKKSYGLSWFVKVMNEKQKCEVIAGKTLMAGGPAAIERK